MLFRSDLSAVGRNFNKRDATLGDWGWHSLNMPSSTQLSIKATTDTDGNYLINTVPYTTDGLQYSVVPTMGVHAFNPSQQPIFVSSSSSVFNAVNFTDVSSFKVTGTVYYEHTDYPVEGANLYIDGVICSKDGESVVTNVRGEYEISVPIGEHHITVKKAGHTFVNDGRYPSDPGNIGSKINFDREMTNVNFKDNTLVTLVGRVVGGKIESDKPFGMGLSEIGRAHV